MELEGQRVLVVGAAQSGLAAARFLHGRGARVTISDRRVLEDMPEARELAQKLGAALEAGGHTQQTFVEQDLVVVSPGVPGNLPQLEAARAAGLPVIGEVELASRFLRGRIVAITGSNGKTTTTALTGQIFQTAGFHAQVGGNIGKPYPPLIELVETSRPETINVVEVSSFQLETICAFRPAVAVVLNVTPDHLDRHATFDRYADAKARIFTNQTTEDFAVLNADDAVCRRYADRTRAQVRWFSRTRAVERGAFVEDGDVVLRGIGIPACPPTEAKSASERDRQECLSYTIFGEEEIPLKGTHNVENVLAAVCAAMLLGADPQLVRAGVRAFRAVEHRLEYVATIGGVEYYNDSKATNVDATIKALEAFEGNLLVILGGLDKGSDYSVLRPLLAKRARCALLIGSAADKIAGHLGDSVPLVHAQTLENAMAEAARRARSGDVVLLAPACASFDQFQNYEHRGRVFKELVARLARGGRGTK